MYRDNFSVTMKHERAKVDDSHHYVFYSRVLKSIVFPFDLALQFLSSDVLFVFMVYLIIRNLENIYYKIHLTIS